VADNCRALRLILHDGRPGEVYNIGGGAALTNLDLIAKLLDLCRADASLLRFVPDRKGHDRRYALDDSKIRTELGYAPEVPFDAGLAEVVRWYQDNHSWWAPLRRAELIRQEALR
jgi:dTDP-glucose 4,6-dehydratase